MSINVSVFAFVFGGFLVVRRFKFKVPNIFNAAFFNKYQTDFTDFRVIVLRGFTAVHTDVRMIQQIFGNGMDEFDEFA